MTDHEKVQDKCTYCEVHATHVGEGERVCAAHIKPEAAAEYVRLDAHDLVAHAPLDVDEVPTLIAPWMGSAYRLGSFGELLVAPMWRDGTIDTENWGEVEFGLALDEEDARQCVVIRAALSIIYGIREQEKYCRKCEQWVPVDVPSKCNG